MNKPLAFGRKASCSVNPTTYWVRVDVNLSECLFLFLFLFCLFQHVRRKHWLSSFTYHLFFNRGGRWSTTDDFTTSFLHFSLFSTVLWDLASSKPVRSLMLPLISFSVCLVFFPLSLCLTNSDFVWCKILSGHRLHKMQIREAEGIEILTYSEKWQSAVVFFGVPIC